MGRRGVIAGQVLEVLHDGSRHCWTIEDLHEGLLRRGLASDLSSVFRAVTRLEEDGKLTRVPIDDRRSHYEIAGDHHEHLVCQVCGAVEPVDCSAVASLVERVRATSGFEVTGHWAVLSGTCATCLSLAPRGLARGEG